ncbi:signal transduction histidine kinase [Kribbella amoyensis]|uniref:histidine kinase n=1 Tax=Kribbella amoyensis TaxID=996641 RepID=A0A561BW04_9ACTN|nr:ATP-binding protein [Kribbella amoyensis]TWD83018.1 signal transduction histidine kinase [Kribbella amoyensis]
MSVRARLSRLPLRARLVAGFSAATFVVLVAAGGFVYWRVDYALDRSLDTELTQASTTLEPLVRPDGQVSNRAAAEATGAAWQILDANGTVLDHGGPAGTNSLVGQEQLDQVGTTPHTFDVGAFLPVSHEPYRLHVAKLSASQYLLVGVRRDHRDEALRELLLQLTLAGLGLLVVTAFVGDRLAKAALRPVERYRRRAAEIASGAADLRLDVPPDRDDEITRLGHTFNDMLATLEGALERERQFVNEASHELRTPITLLTSRIQLALRKPRTLEEHERTLTELKVDLDRLAALAEQLLQLSSLDGKGQRSGDLVNATGRVVNQRRLADPGDVGRITVKLPTGDLEVPLADFEIDRILTNLLDNAATHGTAPYEVTVDEPEQGWARLTVTDAGPGMPPALLANATQRFARADEARTRPGSGLGLALVATLVTQAGGELRLCHANHHTTHGHGVPIPCTHGPAMTATVLLPGVDATRA